MRPTPCSVVPARPRSRHRRCRRGVRFGARWKQRRASPRASRVTTSRRRVASLRARVGCRVPPRPSRTSRATTTGGRRSWAWSCTSSSRSTRNSSPGAFARPPPRSPRGSPLPFPRVPSSPRLGDSRVDPPRASQRPPRLRRRREHERRSLRRRAPRRASLRERARGGPRRAPRLRPRRRGPARQSLRSQTLLLRGSPSRVPDHPTPPPHRPRRRPRRHAPRPEPKSKNQRPETPRRRTRATWDLVSLPLHRARSASSASNSRRTRASRRARETRRS